MAPTFRVFYVAALVISAVALSGCLGAPEHCSGCLARLADAGPLVPGDAAAETGGGSTGGAGVMGSGGVIGSGGVAATGGAGGTVGQGGVSGTGGSGTGAAATGGTAAGGAGTGGLGTGGAGTGGAGTGGTGTGGTGTGGTGTGGRATGGAGGAGGNGTDPDLVLWYKFDESSGTTAADSALFGGTARTAMLGTAGTGGTATFSTTKQVGTNALRLTPTATSPNVNGGYVSLPTGLQTLAPVEITIAVWINLTANTATQNWERVYDFGTGGPPPANMYLTARAADGVMTPVRFAITTTGHAATAEQRLDGATTLSAAAWHHIVVVLPAGATYTGTLYIDGVVAATNPAMTLHMADVGVTTNNWIGKSQFTGNAHFDGLVDDFRVYKRALSPAEITALFAMR